MVKNDNSFNLIVIVSYLFIFGLIVYESTLQTFNSLEIVIIEIYYIIGLMVSLFKVLGYFINDKTLVYAILCLYIASIMFVILMWSLPYWLSCSQPCYF